MSVTLSRAGVAPARIAAWLLMCAAAFLTLRLGLVPALLGGLAVFHLTHRLAAPIGRVARPGRARLAAVALLAIAVAGAVIAAVFGLWYLFNSETGGYDALLSRLMQIIDGTRDQIPGWLQAHLPENLPALRRAEHEWVAAHGHELDVAGVGALRVALHLVVGMMVGGMIAITSLRTGTATGCFALEMLERVRRLSATFGQTVSAQVRISLINTVCTGVFLLGILPLFSVHVPLAKSLVLITFVCGLLPVIGNLISNTVIAILALSVSFYVAVAALAYLVVIHKLEYFLNARIIGGRIQASAWELLLAMFVLEAAFGMPGLIMAPFLYGYAKREMIDQGWI